ncbi:MAG: DUF547 domain-containing protein [Ectothiorhodospiraceae bacterium]|nr:DUF547 domain-containing protein [Ectothiorhodospiraceae bacterium]
MAYARKRIPGLSALLLACWIPQAFSDGRVADAFSDYQELLDRFLTERALDNDGLVSAFDYRAALADDDTMQLLGRQRERLAAFDASGIGSRETANAFWLNTYNFFMIAHILEERPNGELVDSVWDYGGRINPFRENVFERPLFAVDGRLHSLDDMEKGILLGDTYWERGWAEARVHFAVNCASVGCPPLRADIYTPDNLDDLLTENTRLALNTHYHLRVDGDTLHLSKLFDWYEEDYVREAGSVRDFIRTYADDRVIEAMEGATRIRYIDYDWTLNAPENFPELED